MPSAESDPAEAGDHDTVAVTLPEPVRLRVIARAADALPALGDGTPAALRRFTHFATARRVRHAGPALAAALAADPAFRDRVAEHATEAAGPLGTAVASGTAPAAADPVEVAALAYLCRPDGWERLVAAAATALTSVGEAAALAARDKEIERLQAQLERARQNARADADKLRADLHTVRAEADAQRGKVQSLGRSLRDAEAETRRLTEALSTERGRLAAAVSTADAELRRVRARLADVERELDTARAARKSVRAVDDARLWLLIETVVNSAKGLQRELAVGPPDKLPADLVAAEEGRNAAGGDASPRWAADDPARLDKLLVLPKAHLVVDGYNVTKTGFPESSLEQQRNRLVTGLGGVVSQTGAEVTVVFDGAERRTAPVTPRGVRVLFSAPGETADEVIRLLVRKEPPGRVVIVVSSDNEVADGVRRMGARPVQSAVLVRRLGRV